MASRILIVDDEEAVASAFARILKREGHEVETVLSAERALELLEKGSVDLLLTDISMPGMDGLELLERVRKRGDSTPAVVISGHGTIVDAVKAVKLGALDFVEKPVHHERLLLTVRNALRFSSLADAHDRLQADVRAEQRLVGDGAVMRKLRELISRVAPSDGRVLITGENGTGKELVAAAIHAGSERKNNPFVKLNCSAVPKDLVESELFGHEKGAFTGAVSSRKGRFELADRGTLFLDEIGDMPLAMQVKLLRVLQEGQFERVGGGRTLTVDVRVIAATNQNPEQMVHEGSFREDLFYRLNVVSLRVPALRERKEDIPALVAHFLAAEGAGLTVTEEAVEALKQHDFPGNVRELKNVIERLGILYPTETILARHIEEVLPRPQQKERPALQGLYRAGSSLKDLIREAEKRILTEAIAASGNNKTAAAQALGIDKSFFYKKCRQLGIGGDE
jgi:DNA-binding NtrC family response regulator